MTTLSEYFQPTASWNRPVHEANRQAIPPGAACCFLVPNTANRVVIEMWGQGGGGGGGCCCMWGIVGGQGGTYSSKVFSGTQSPASTGQCMSFCGCACACDCMSPGIGQPGQFSKLTNCTTSAPADIGGWVGCSAGGASGCMLCLSAQSWVCSNFGINCNPQNDTSCISQSIGADKYLNITTMSTAQNSTCNGGSVVCCAGSSCYCASQLCSSTCVGAQHTTAPLQSVVPQTALGLDGVFAKQVCSCFDQVRTGACGWTKGTILGYNSTWNHCDHGVGGAAWGGGAQQKNNFSMGNFSYCGWAGNFPGGGGKSSAVCGGGCCLGSIGGGGLILISWG